ncbi:MAG TPA: LysR family transcriptional regulator [Candidatus Fimimorpha faecalis]|uniref:LysR family transcriptional regulator n=1 Tax=Candidatus Fimimorpha faecalis TaxID=2840824 RepID=A0A9D1JBX8_9FIRM|nr:LysR family transcriptional regulator [Candidatus Fimimorpha faecalis]
MNTTQLECFLHVAKHLNFSKASGELNISQPAVSHQIQSLEEELEVKLFQRTSKTVSLTPEGILFLPDAEKILKIALTAKERLYNPERPMILEIGCHNQAELDLLPPIIKELKREYPLFRPLIHLVPFESLSNLLKTGQIHVMFGFKGDYSNASLSYRELYQCPICCSCSKNHPFANYTSLTKHMLQGKFILCSPNKISDSIFQIQSHIASRSPISDRYLGEEYETVITFIKSDFGYTLLPKLPSLHDPELCYIPIVDYPTISFGIYYQDTNYTSLLKQFWQLLKQTNPF